MMSNQYSFGPYVCTQVLGMGSNNTVYQATHRPSGGEVVLRVMPIINNATDILQECLRQIEVFASLQASNTVPILDYGHDRDTLYIATPIMVGGTLEERLQYATRDPQRYPLPNLDEIRTMLESLSLALDAIHSQGMVHGQIEPRNILFDADGQAYLADVGLTRLFKIIYGLGATNSFNMSKYSAPELWDGERPTAQSDQYAVACILYELLTGRTPFIASSIYDLMKQHMNDPAMPPHYVRRDLPSELSFPFWQALAKPPEKRHGSMYEFYLQFARAVQDRQEEPTGFFVFPLK